MDLYGLMSLYKTAGMRKYAKPFFSTFSLIGRGQKDSRRRSPAKVSQGFGKKAATESVTVEGI